MGALYWILAMATCTMIAPLQSVCVTADMGHYQNQGQCHSAYHQIEQDNTIASCIPICTTDGYVCGGWSP